MRLVFGLLLIVTAVYSFGQQDSQTVVGPEFADATLQAPISGSSANLPDAPSHVALQQSTNPPRPQSEQDPGLVLTSRAKSPGNYSIPVNIRAVS